MLGIEKGKGDGTEVNEIEHGCERAREVRKTRRNGSVQRRPPTVLG